MSRDEILFSMFDASGFGLEIGPSYNPFLPKDQFNVETLDYADQETLIAKYKNDPGADATRIGPVDYVSDGRSIAEIIPRRGEYDYVFASHVIEHTTDMLTFVNDCSLLLKPEGKLVLVVPDSLSCFDIFRPLSSAGQVLQAFIEKRRRHPPGIGFDHVAYNATRNGAPGWWLSDDGPLAFKNTVASAGRFFRALQETTDYHDLHAWQFSPNSFRLMMHDLNEAGFTDLREAAFHAPVTGFEFFVALSRDGAGPDISRLDLAQSMVRDLGRALTNWPACAVR